MHYSSILLGATSTPLSNNLTIEKFKVYLSSLNTKIIFTDKKDFEISNYKIVNIEHFGDFINLISKFSSDRNHNQDVNPNQLASYVYFWFNWKTKRSNVIS